MPRFAANLTMLFNEVPFLERFEHAAQAGFRAVEFLFPYEYKSEDLKRLLKETRLELVLHNLPPGDWNAGERGLGCHPDRIGYKGWIGCEYKPATTTEAGLGWRTALTK